MCFFFFGLVYELAQNASVSCPSLQAGTGCLRFRSWGAGRVQCFTTCSVWICSRILSFSFQNYVVQPWVSLNSSSPDCSWLNSNISSFRRDLAAWQWAFPGSVFHGPLLVQWYTFCPGRIYGEINWDWCARINMENLWGMWIFDTWMHCKPAKK